MQWLSCKLWSPLYVLNLSSLSHSTRSSLRSCAWSAKLGKVTPRLLQPLEPVAFASPECNFPKPWFSALERASCDTFGFAECLRKGGRLLPTLPLRCEGVCVRAGTFSSLKGCMNIDWFHAPQKPALGSISLFHLPPNGPLFSFVTQKCLLSNPDASNDTARCARKVGDDAPLSADTCFWKPGRHFCHFLDNDWDASLSLSLSSSSHF